MQFGGFFCFKKDRGLVVVLQLEWCCAFFYPPKRCRKVEKNSYGPSNASIHQTLYTPEDDERLEDENTLRARWKFGKSSEPNHHDFRFQLLIFGVVNWWVYWRFMQVPGNACEKDVPFLVDPVSEWVKTHRLRFPARQIRCWEAQNNWRIRF